MGRTCLKFAVIFFNLILMLIGAAALGVGVWVLVNDQDFLEKSVDVLDIDILGTDLLDRCALALITVGAVVFVLGSLGCVGAFSLCSFVLSFYSMSLVLLLTVQVAVLVLIIVFRDELLESADNEVKDRLITQYGDIKKSFTKSFDTLQKELDCCGWENGDDFKQVDRNVWNVTMDTGDTRLVPDSCCPSSDSKIRYNCTMDPTNSSVYNAEGCKQKVEDKLEKYIWVIIGITAGLLGFQFLLISLSMCLVVKNVGKKYEM